MVFSGNSAHSGSAVLMNGLDLCSYPNFRTLDKVFRWDFIEFGYARSKCVTIPIMY